MTMTTFAEAEARLVETLPGYESREQQQNLAVAVEECIASGRHLLGQAGCGCGKSLATIIPAILAGKRAIVSTATKGLQDQIANKDLPFLAEHLGVPFTYALLKGRSNYVCVAALADETSTEVCGEVLISRIRTRTEDDAFDGERDNLGFEVDNKQWRSLTMTSDECPGKAQCPFSADCYAEKAKARAQESHIVVVNHALLCTDAFVKEVTDGFGTMIGEYDVAIIDEAHELREYATNAMTTRITEGSFIALVGEVRNFARTLRNDEQASTVNLLGGDVLNTARILWESLPSNERGQSARLRRGHITDNRDPWVNTVNALFDFNEAVRNLSLDNVDTKAERAHEKARTRKSKLLNRSHNLHARIVDIIKVADTALVRWIETETYTTRRGVAQESKAIKSAPVDVAPMLKQWFWERHLVEHERFNTHTGENYVVHEAPLTAILVSATLAPKPGQEGFDYMARTLGVPNPVCLDAGSPFDYETQARLYIPSHLPDPKKNTAAWSAMSITEMGELVRISDGRALLLFTSRKEMDNAYETLVDGPNPLPYTCFKQGQAPNKILAERFVADHHSVLFALKSFFQGVDFQGDTLSLVVINKLPFAVPTEPMNEARCEVIEARGGNVFGDFVVPEMTLPLQQAFGRLIRHRNDNGVVAILDPRIKKAGYGKGILRSLPPAPQCETTDEVRSFFEGLDN